MEQIFNRQLKVYTKEGQEKLAAATVLMIGCGGLGSTVSLVLSRSGVGHLVIVDCDTVSLSNIHRQILYGKDDIDKPKVEVAAARAAVAVGVPMANPAGWRMRRGFR